MELPKRKSPKRAPAPTPAPPVDGVTGLRAALGLRPLDEIVAAQVVKARKARQRTPPDIALVDEAHEVTCRTAWRMDGGRSLGPGRTHLHQLWPGQPSTPRMRL